MREILQRCAKLEHVVAVVFERRRFSTKDCMLPCTVKSMIWSGARMTFQISTYADCMRPALYIYSYRVYEAARGWRTYHTYTVPSRKRAHYRLSAHPPLWAHFGLTFLLRSKVYSNMRPYVAALEHACAISIKWAWLRSLAVHGRSFEAETRHKTN